MTSSRDEVKRGDTLVTVPYDIVADIIKVLDRVSRGVVPTTACDDLNVSYTTFCAYTKRFPQLAQMRQEAEDRCYDTLADKLLTVHEDIEDPKMAGVASSNVKWLLERRRSAAYGSKSTLDVNVNVDRDVLNALQNAKARAEGRLIEVEVISDVLDLTLIDAIERVVPRVLDQPDLGTDFDEEGFQAELSEIS